MWKAPWCITWAAAQPGSVLSVARAAATKVPLIGNPASTSNPSPSG